VAHQEGEIELILYYADETPEPVRLLFRGLFERFLSRRELSISRYQPVICPRCGERLERNVVMQQLDRGRRFSFCNTCGERLDLPPVEGLTSLPAREEAKLVAQQAIVKRRTAFEAALVRLKGLLRDRGQTGPSPACFISYSWGVFEHEQWVVRFAKDMQNAGIDVLLDRWHNPPGHSLSRFTDQIVKSEFVLVVGTPELRGKYETESADPVVASELELINTRLMQPSRYGRKVIPLLLAGEPHTSFTPQLQDPVYIDFRDESFYFVHLFKLIWHLFNLQLDHPALDDLLAAMSPARDDFMSMGSRE
jgi:hypothetical protein